VLRLPPAAHFDEIATAQARCTRFTNDVNNISSAATDLGAHVRWCATPGARSWRCSAILLYANWQPDPDRLS
jgi:hypothetical protein